MHLVTIWIEYKICNLAIAYRAALFFFFSTLVVNCAVVI